VTAFDSGGNQNLSLGVAGGNEGIGGANGGNGLSDTGGEGLRIQLDEKGRFFGVTLDDFGTIPAGAPSWAEQVQLRFINTATSQVFNITKAGCRDDGGLASFASLDPGFEFDVIEIRPQPSTPDALGTTTSSSFLVSAFMPARLERPVVRALCRPQEISAPEK
jgi:hypothetical protein